MAKQEIDLVDSKTEGENHQREDTKPGILYDSTILQNNVPKAMKSENDNKNLDVEGNVIKTELRCEIGNDSDSETVACKRMSAEHEVLNVAETAKRIDIKSETEEHQNQNEENQNQNEENQIGFSVKKLKDAFQNNKANVSNVVQRKSLNEKESFKSKEKIFK